MQKEKSLVKTISIVISVLLVIIISAVAFIMYNSSQNEIFRKFTDVGEKLRDIAEGDVETIESIANIVEGGDDPTGEDADILKGLLDSTINDRLVANAYCFSSDYEETAGGTTFTYVLTNKELRNIGLDAGATYEDDGVFSVAFKRAASGEATLTDMFTDEYGYWITFLAPIQNNNGEIIAIYGVDFDYNLVEKGLNTLVF